MNAPLKPLPAGIHAGIPLAQYLSDDALSAGTCHTLLTYSPLHAKHARENRGDSSTDADIGTCAHSILLEGHQDGVAVINPADYPSQKNTIPDGWTNNAIRAARDAAYASGKTPILKARMAEVLAMVDAALEFVGRSELAGIFQRGRPELTMVWREDKLRCRARPDWLQDDHAWILDYKTGSGSVNPFMWKQHMLRMGYHVKAAFYQRGLEAITGTNAQFVFLAQETEAPYACALHGMEPSLQAYADEQASIAIERWRDCISRNSWPGHPASICYHDLPPYLGAQWEEKKAVDEWSADLAAQA
jgi:hypothetical protein